MRSAIVFAGILVLGFFGPQLTGSVLLVAQEAAVVTGGESPSPAGEWGSSVVWAFLMSSALEWAKRKNFIAFISPRTSWAAQRVFGIVLAFSTAAGIHYSFDATAGALTITGLLWPNIFEALGETIRQFVFQEIIYRTSIRTYSAE